MATESGLIQQGYDASPERLRELSWALRFTPTVCMAGAVCGLATRQPWIHFTLAALGILPFWAPAWNPIDRLYNHLLRPLWNGVRLPPNPLPRRIACLTGGTMNAAIGVAFTLGQPVVAYGLGAVLVSLQIVVITTHFCVASWMYEGLLRAIGRWVAPLPLDEAERRIAAGARVIDVREPDEFARGHVAGARNVPLDRVVEELGRGSDDCLLFYCQSGLRSQRAVQLLKRNGLTEVHNLGGLPRLRGHSAFSYKTAEPVL